MGGFSKNVAARSGCYRQDDEVGDESAVPADGYSGSRRRRSSSSVLGTWGCWVSIRCRRARDADRELHPAAVNRGPTLAQRYRRHRTNPRKVVLQGHNTPTKKRRQIGGDSAVSKASDASKS